MSEHEVIPVNMWPTGQARKLGEDKRHREFLKKVREDISYKESHTNPGRIKLFGISCSSGTDDFFFFSFFALAVRAAW